MRGKAKRDRASEQLIWLRYEMIWTVAYFRKQAVRWMERMNASVSGVGHRCYAARQIAMWNTFAEQAEERFSLFRS
jgi:hypothetical protein